MLDALLIQMSEENQIKNLCNCSRSLYITQPKIETRYVSFQNISFNHYAMYSCVLSLKKIAYELFKW